jgi:hypothetical protein
VASARRPECDLVRIHPNHAAANDRCEPIEAPRGRPEPVVAQAVELRAVRRVIYCKSSQWFEEIRSPRCVLRAKSVIGVPGGPVTT